MSTAASKPRSRATSRAPPMNNTSPLSTPHQRYDSITCWPSRSVEERTSTTILVLALQPQTRRRQILESRERFVKRDPHALVTRQTEQPTT